MRRLFLLSFLSSILFSCSSEDQLQEIKVNNLYSISIPAFLSVATDLNEDASLQYMDGTREYYVIVIDENKEEFHEAISSFMFDEKFSKDLDGYVNLLLENFSYSAEVKSKTKITETTINGMPARLININARFDDVDVFCSLSYLEGKNNYYQVFAWTLLSNETLYKESLNAIAHTLKEI